MQSRILAILVAIVLAMVAVMALVVYVHSADRRAISGQQPVDVFVAKSLIQAGLSGRQAQNRGLIEQVQLPRKAVAAGAVTDLTAIADKTAAVDIVAGEQLINRRWVSADVAEGQHLLPIPADRQAVSVAVEGAKQVAGFITPGDHVDVIVSYNAQRYDASDKPVGSAIPHSTLLLQDVPVLAIGGTAAPNPAQNGAKGKAAAQSGGLTTVTLSVKPQSATKLVFAAENGRLYLSLRPPKQAPIQPPPDVKTILPE